MFTGIVTAIGTIRSITPKGDLHAVIGCPFDPAKIAIGASIACSGVCLTVVDKGGETGDAWFAVDISGEPWPHRAGPVARGPRAEPGTGAGR
jgi:riboflavin synthase